MDDLKQLTKALKSDDLVVKFSAIQVLGSRGTDACQAWEALHRQMKHENPVIRVAAAAAVFSVVKRDTMAESFLTEYTAVNDAVKVLVSSAKLAGDEYALGNVTDSSKGISLEFSAGVPDFALHALQGMVNALASQDKYEQLKAAHALARNETLVVQAVFELAFQEAPSRQLAQQVIEAIEAVGKADASQFKFPVVRKVSERLSVRLLKIRQGIDITEPGFREKMRMAVCSIKRAFSRKSAESPQAKEIPPGNQQKK